MKLGLFRLIAPAAVIAAGAVLLSATSIGPARAEPFTGDYIFEDGVNLWQGSTTPDLQGVDDIQDMIDANSTLFGEQVDFVGRVEFDNDTGIFTEEGDTQGFLPIGSLFVTCVEFKDDDCIGFDWAFDFTTLDLTWKIVKIAAKGGQSSGAWALDPFALDDSGDDIIEGEFRCADYRALFGGDLEDCDEGPTIKGISHLDFFGVNTTIPEPMTLALFGLGLLGLGAARRRWLA